MRGSNCSRRCARVGGAVFVGCILEDGDDNDDDDDDSSESSRPSISESCASRVDSKDANSSVSAATS